MTASKIVAAAASGVGGATLDVDDVFSTYLYDGTGSAQNIQNGIDLTEGGLVWSKVRSNGFSHALIDTERGVNNFLKANANNAQDTGHTDTITSFNSNGYSLGSDSSEWFWNRSGEEYVSWTWRKAPKFFDVVTYTGNGTQNRKISHNLGSTPGMIITKCSSNSADPWAIFHRSNTTNYLKFDTTTGSSLGGQYGNAGTHVAPTSTEYTVASGGLVNESGRSYVAYLFAHNNNDGGFGPDGDQDIIKCGSFTGNHNAEADIDLGFEPQWIMIKSSSADDNDGWEIYDTMRGIVVGENPKGDEARLKANTSDAEGSGNAINQLNATGWSAQEGSGNTTYIYMAIRRGPLAVPEDATKVFAIDQENSSAPYFTSGFPVDFALAKLHNATQAWRAYSRLTQGKELYPNETGAEGVEADAVFDYMNGHYSASQNSGYYSWMWKRAPGYFDVVAYTGTGSSSARAVPHNLGVVPEMMWVKQRATNGGEGWAVYHKGLNGGTDPEDYYVSLHTTNGEYNNFYRWADTAPTATNFYVTNDLDRSGGDIIAYLFATAPGVSKVGSYTGNGSAQNIDCGFSNGARFVLIKNSSTTSNWVLVDSVRGLVSGDDKWLALESTASQYTFDLIDPYSSGFALASGETNVNTTGSTYIFYAIA